MVVVLVPCGRCLDAQLVAESTVDKIFYLTYHKISSLKNLRKKKVNGKIRNISITLDLSLFYFSIHGVKCQIKLDVWWKIFKNNNGIHK